MESYGPELWYILHSTAYYFNYDSLISKSYIYVFLCIFSLIIPCNVCKNFYDLFLVSNCPNKYIEHNKLIEWTILLHNSVNKKLGKPIVEKTVVDDLYLNKSLDIKRIINFLKQINELFYKLSHQHLIYFITNYQFVIHPDIRDKFIEVSITDNLLYKSNFSEKYTRKWFKKINKLF